MNDSTRSRVGTLERGVVEAPVRVELGIEIVVIVAQPLEPGEIFVVIDRGEQAADLPELLALVLAREMAVLDQRVENVGLADRDELVPVRGRAVVVAVIRRHGSR